jgi:hypothetical protein
LIPEGADVKQLRAEDVGEKKIQMLNKAPIFINGFQRGGTNILQNLIASHPDVCLLNGEVHEVCYGKSGKPVQQLACRLFCLPVVVMSRQHVFHSRRLEERKHIPYFMRGYVDALFFGSKMIAPKNKIRNETETNSVKQIAGSRLLGKNVNGGVLATDILLQIYPDVTFIALVRNGLALCESFVRRGADAKDVGIMYQKICQKMLRDADCLDNYQIIRFEDMITNPVATIKQIYDCVRLDLSEVPKFKLQSKLSMNEDGVREYTFGSKDRTIQWFSMDQLNGYLRKDVNQNQIAQLSSSDKDIFLEHAQTSMEQLGYL